MSFWLVAFFLAAAHPGYVRTLHSGCVHNDTFYGDGEEVNTGEPCLVCSCRRGALTCSLRLCANSPVDAPPGCVVLHNATDCCPRVFCGTNLENNGIELRTVSKEDVPAEKKDCVVEGNLYAEGSTIASSSACEYCYCSRGQVECVKPRCQKSLKGCVPIFEPTSCCPTHFDCSASSPDSVTRTTGETFGNLQQSQGCESNGIFYAEGEEIPSAFDSKCEMCHCVRGQRVCGSSGCREKPKFESCRSLASNVVCGKVASAEGSVSYGANVTLASLEGATKTTKKKETRENIIKIMPSSEPALSADAVVPRSSSHKYSDGRSTYIKTPLFILKKNVLSDPFNAEGATFLKSNHGESKWQKMKEQKLTVAYKNAVFDYYPGEVETFSAYSHKKVPSEEDVGISENSQSTGKQDDESKMKAHSSRKSILLDALLKKLLFNGFQTESNVSIVRFLEQFEILMPALSRYPQVRFDEFTEHGNLESSRETTSHDRHSFDDPRRPTHSTEERNEMPRPQKAETRLPNLPISGELSKLAGCNIYGRMHRVGSRVRELSGPCQSCVCTQIGVKCTSFSCRPKV